jgi:hypothetical protein
MGVETLQGLTKATGKSLVGWGHWLRTVMVKIVGFSLLFWFQARNAEAATAPAHKCRATARYH